MKKLIIFFAVIATALPLVLSACKNGAEPGTTETVTDNQAAITTAERSNDGYILEDGLFITDIYPYSGVYYEDGGNEICANVCAVRLLNKSDVNYRYIRFSIRTAGGEYSFSASTLFSGASMTVLCENKAEYTDGIVQSVRMTVSALFEDAPTVHLDEMQISYTDGFVNVKNLTDKTLHNVYVYYKDTDSFGYLGGITYRVPFGDIPAGETRQAGSSNMKRETCKVVFSTYIDEQ